MANEKFRAQFDTDEAAETYARRLGSQRSRQKGVTMKLTEIKGNKESMALCTALFNYKGLNAYRMAHGNEDTEFFYGIYTDTKMSKHREESLANFIAGFKAGLQVYY